MGEAVKMTEEEHGWLVRRMKTLSTQLGWACLVGIAMAWSGGLSLVLGTALGSHGWAWFGIYVAATGAVLAVVTGRVWLRRGRRQQKLDDA